MWPINIWKNETYGIINNLFSPEECNEIIKLGKTYKQNYGITESDNALKYRNSRIAWMSIDEKTAYLYKKIHEATVAANTLFEYDLSYIEDIQFTEYKEGEFYGVHKDMGFSDSFSRKLSFVMQLTDPTEYEGGELILYDTNIKDPFIVPKEKGTIVMFPSYILHEVKPITKGIRNSLVTWIHGPRFR